jgi:hypothetical protein
VARAECGKVNFLFCRVAGESCTRCDQRSSSRFVVVRRRASSVFARRSAPAAAARSPQLRCLVLADTARIVGIGLVAGLALAVAGVRLIRSLLYQVEPLDPLVLVTTAAVIFGLALLVSLRPALGATRADLNRTLREE